MPDAPAPKPTRDWLNVVAKWRTFFASWQFGTRPKGDAECDAVRDHRELTILLRVEQNALARLLIEKGVFTAEEWTNTLHDEARLLAASYERQFPGFHCDEVGMHLRMPEAATTMGRMRFKP